MFKVLVIAYYFPPMGLSGVQRTLKFCKYLKQYNWEPTILTASLTGYYAHDYSLQKEAEEANLNIVRIKGSDINSKLAKKGTIKMPSEFIRKTFSRLSSIFFVPDNKIGWSKKALTEARRLLEQQKFDLIFVSAPPFSSITASVKLKKEFNIPLVVDYRDLWLGNQFSFYATPFHKYLNKKFEYSGLKAADKIIVINRKIKEKILNNYKFLSFEDIYIIPQGYDPSDIANSIPEKRSTKKMILSYCGIFYEYITPKYFLQAFKKLLNERPDVASNIELHFIGFLRKENHKLIKKLNIQEYVREHGYLDHSDSLRKILSADVLWATVGRGKNNDTISLGKVFEYFGTRKPIMLCAADGASKTAAEEYGAAFICSPDSVDEISNTLLHIYELYETKSFPVPNEEFIEKHRRDFLTEQLSKQFQFLVKEGIH